MRLTKHHIKMLFLFFRTFYFSIFSFILVGFRHPDGILKSLLTKEYNLEACCFTCSLFSFFFVYPFRTLLTFFTCVCFSTAVFISSWMRYMYFGTRYEHVLVHIWFSSVALTYSKWILIMWRWQQLCCHHIPTSDKFLFFVSFLFIFIVFSFFSVYNNFLFLSFSSTLGVYHLATFLLNMTCYICFALYICMQYSSICYMPHTIPERLTNLISIFICFFFRKATNVCYTTAMTTDIFYQNNWTKEWFKSKTLYGQSEWVVLFTRTCP